MFDGAQGAKGNRVVKTRLVDFDKAVTVSCDGVQCRVGISMKLQSILRQVQLIIAQFIVTSHDTFTEKHYFGEEK